MLPGQGALSRSRAASRTRIPHGATHARPPGPHEHRAASRPSRPAKSQDLRLHDLSGARACRSDQPYLSLPVAAALPRGISLAADFLDLQGEFSDKSTPLRFMLPATAALEALSAAMALVLGITSSLQHRHEHVGDALLVDVEIAGI